MKGGRGPAESFDVFETKSRYVLVLEKQEPLNIAIRQKIINDSKTKKCENIKNTQLNEMKSETAMDIKRETEEGKDKHIKKQPNIGVDPPQTCLFVGGISAFL